MWKEHFLASAPDELLPGNITFTETNRDLHSAAAICSGSKPKGCNIELVRLELCKFSLFLYSRSYNHRNGKQWSLFVFMVYRNLNRCHNSLGTSNPWKGTGWCLGITEGRLHPDKLLSQLCCSSSTEGPSGHCCAYLSCIQLLYNTHKICYISLLNAATFWIRSCQKLTITI